MRVLIKLSKNILAMIIHKFNKKKMNQKEI